MTLRPRGLSRPWAGIALQWELVTLGLVVLVLVGLCARPSTPSLVSHDSLRAGRDSVDRIIQEHTDSGRTLVDRATTRERVVTRYVTRIDTLRERVEVFVEREDWKGAYEAQTVVVADLRTTLAESRRATDDALRASAYWQLAYLADSTQREGEWRVQEQLARELRQAVKRKPSDYVSVGCYYGFRGPDCGIGARFPLRLPFGL